jgi:hypothetical protein
MSSSSEGSARVAEAIMSGSKALKIYLPEARLLLRVHFSVRFPVHPFGGLTSFLQT